MYIIKLKYNFFVKYQDKMNSYLKIDISYTERTTHHDIATKNLIYSENYRQHFTQDQIIPYNIGFMPFS